MPFAMPMHAIPTHPHPGQRPSVQPTQSDTRGWPRLSDSPDAEGRCDQSNPTGWDVQCCTYWMYVLYCTVQHSTYHVHTEPAHHRDARPALKPEPLSSEKGLPNAVAVVAQCEASSRRTLCQRCLRQGIAGNERRGRDSKKKREKETRAENEDRHHSRG